MNHEHLLFSTANLARPIVVRNALKTEHMQLLADHNVWSERYGNTSINCNDMGTEFYKECTVNELIDYNLKDGRNIYSRTNHYILWKHPELLEMVKSPITPWIGDAPLYEIFIGFKSGGSPLHAAFGLNAFKQIVGRKKWTLIAPAELPFMDIHLSDDGVSLLALITDGKIGATFSDAPWLKKINRYEVVMGPGDLLLNPSMWMHIVENLPGAQEQSMVIGSPERHLGIKYGLRTSPYIAFHLVTKRLLIKAYQKMMGIAAPKSAQDFFPINTEELAEQFDKYIRNRAIELGGELE